MMMQPPQGSEKQIKKVSISVFELQNGYSNHVNNGLVWYSNGRFVSGCQMVRYLNGGLKTGLKKTVYGPKCLVLE